MSFFENKSIIMERVKLVEDIPLPESIDDYKNTKAKFYINILTPLVDKSKVNSTSKPAPTTSKFNNNNLNPSDYEQVNYIVLTIPRYILMQFKDVVPAGTEFIINCIGEFKIIHFRIIGIYTLDESEE